MIQPFILDIKANSLDDGPGIRSAVFFKGCPLRCIWCHNPESKKFEAEISYDSEICIGDGGCLSTCPKNALSPEREGFIDRSVCDLCFKCTEFCPAKALTVVGNKISMDELFNKLMSDKVFYDVSGGGVTLSGGEATIATEWVGELAKRLSEAGISVLVETCGYFNYDRVSKYLLPYLKDIYCDIKIYDREKHEKYCGVSNELILENIRKMHNDSKTFGYNLLLRTPLIPGITDTDENLNSIAAFLKEIGESKTELLPYNPTWHHKVDKLGGVVADELKDIISFQNKDQLNHAKAIYQAYGIETI